jgi:hypothetical protein
MTSVGTPVFHLDPDGRHVGTRAQVADALAATWPTGGQEAGRG